MKKETKETLVSFAVAFVFYGAIIYINAIAWNLI
jgi:hypothetical protein